MALAGRVLSQNHHDDGVVKKAEIYDTDRVHSSRADCTLQAEKYDEFKSRNICLGDDFTFICLFAENYFLCNQLQKHKKSPINPGQFHWENNLR